jgi:thiol:disulfide interchange protein
MKIHALPTSLMPATLIAVVALSACGADSVDDGPEAAAFEAVSTHATVSLDWERSWDSAFDRAVKEDKPVLVTFSAEWCVWCKKLESTTYRDSVVTALIADEVVPLTLDVDGDGSELSDTHGVESLPTVLVFSPAGVEQGRINGYLPPGQFVEAMTDILQAS